ncbi:MAG: hypothetical protein ABRQ39_32745 [Candidatus Eremiobacterota bacterium]
MRTKKERIHFIRELREKGLSFEEIGKQLGITKQRANVLYSYDPTLITTTKWSKLYPTFIEEYTINNLPINKIAEKYGCSISVIQNCFKKYGIKANKKRGRKQSSEVTA